ncbi:MAG TPA: SRPBCC domain-containing protein [Pseudonocardiaceae bacterium]
MNAILQTIDGRPALRFERHLAHSVERVWRAVSTPAELERWMPAAADWTPARDEVFELGGQTGQITELDPPHVIAWTFAGQVFRFELSTEGEGCGLVFTHVFDETITAAQTAAGWECYFDQLDAHLVGEHLSEQRAHQPIGQRHERYAVQFGLDPAPGRAFIASLDFRGLTLDDGPMLRLERRYDQPVERVWRVLTEPDELRHWFPGEFEIRHSDPPHVLVGAWHGDGTLRSELRPEGHGCVLMFTHTCTDRDQAALTAAGWDRCFARLDALLAGQAMSEAASLAAWPDVHERYAAAWGIDPNTGRAAYAEHVSS